MDNACTDYETLGLSASELVGLINACQEVKKHSYSVYSNFRVGAALITEKDRRIFSGCNVENASFGLTVCAERSAICTLVSQGYRTFQFIAVISDIEEGFCAPCGACRQVIAEFSPSGYVILVQPGLTNEEYLKGNGTKIISVVDLLPLGFSHGDLYLKKIDTSN